MYNPIKRGLYTVGVRTLQWKNRRRQNHPINIEIWYPAQEYYRGEDLEDETCDHYDWQGQSISQAAVRDADPYPGESPLVGFSHDAGGHRRQATNFTTHLASHGYVMVAIDHVSDDLSERVTDFLFVLERIFAGGLGEDFSPIFDHHYAVSGHGLGGLTALDTITKSENIEAIIGLAPDTEPVNLDWMQSARTMLIAADADDVTSYDEMEALCRQIPAMKSLYLLSDAKHEYFLDNAPPVDGFCAPAEVHLAAGALGVAHLDNALQHKPAAHRWLTENAELSLAEHGVWLKQRF